MILRILHGCSCIIEFIKLVGGKKIKREACNNTGAQMLDSIYHMTQKSVLNQFLWVKKHTCIYATLFWMSLDNDFNQ